jgi:trans-aconitate 2-methyltransferase
LRARLAGRLDRVDVIHADLTAPLPATIRADAAVSVATFHWIADHDALFVNLARHLRPGAQLVAECGGRGNVATVSAAVHDVLDTPAPAWTFAGVDDTRDRLARAGFTDIEVELVPDPARLEPGEPFRTFLRTVILGAELDRLPADQHDTFVRAVADRLDEPVVDYVRLRFSARRA